MTVPTVLIGYGTGARETITRLSGTGGVAQYGGDGGEALPQAVSVIHSVSQSMRPGPCMWRIRFNPHPGF